jgi:hypothetical protein
MVVLAKELRLGEISLGEWRGLLRVEVANTVASPGDIDEELQYLHRILMSGTTPP